METPTYNLTWAALEIVHGMQEGDIQKQLQFIHDLTATPFPNTDARMALGDFVTTCKEHDVKVYPAILTLYGE